MGEPVVSPGQWVVSGNADPGNPALERSDCGVSADYAVNHSPICFAAMPTPWSSVRRALEPVVRASRVPRLRSELGWVLGNRSAEFVLQFVLLKILTNALGRDGYGEYNLAEVGLVLIASFALTPIHDAYMRDFHGARSRDEARASAMFLWWWYAAVTLGTVVCAAVLTRNVGGWLGLSPWTALAAGAVFLFDRWRFLSQEVYNIRRERRAWALRNLGFWVLQVAAVSAAMMFLPRTATNALLAFAAASAVFGLPGMLLLWKEARRLPPGSPTRLPGLVISFGIPAAVLLVFQWVQGFSDRYLMNAMLDIATVGQYVACYQVCGIPYQFLLRLFHSLLTPVAYQRASNLDDPRQLWAADRVLLAGIAAQVAIGGGMLLLYAAFGSELIALLTSEAFVFPTSIVVLLAAGRFVQAFGQSLQPIFAVHHRLQRMIWFRGAGAVLTVVICWWAIERYGVIGAAAGTLVAQALYAVALILGPGGCAWMVNGVRKRSARTVEGELG